MFLQWISSLKLLNRQKQILRNTDFRIWAKFFAQATAKSITLQNRTALIASYSISAGLDYPAVGPEHAYLYETKRVYYDSITDDEALEAFTLLCRLEGIIPALESSHAVAYALKIAKKYASEQSIVISLSGRGDKDMGIVVDRL